MGNLGFQFQKTLADGLPNADPKLSTHGITSIVPTAFQSSAFSTLSFARSLAPKGRTIANGNSDKTTQTLSDALIFSVVLSAAGVAIVSTGHICFLKV